MIDIFALVGKVELPRVETLGQFIAFQKFLHATMRATVDLFEDAVKHSTGDLQEYFKVKAEEEREHDVWLERDIVALGERPSTVDHAAAALTGAQYYYIRHIGAHAFLGYLVAMEGRPMPLSDVAALEKAYGVPGCRTLRFHAEHDPEHALRLREIVAMHDDNVIAYNAAMTAHLFRHFVIERMEEAHG